MPNITYRKIFYLTAAILVGFLMISSGVNTAGAADPTDIMPSPTPAAQIDYNLPYPGLLPDHPLYFIKNIRDKILLYLTRNGVKKSQVYLLLSDKKISAGKALFEKDSQDLGIKTFEAAEKNLLAGVLTLGNYQKNAVIPPGVVDKFELADLKHEEVITGEIASISDPLRKQELNNVLYITHQAKGQITLLKAVR